MEAADDWRPLEKPQVRTPQTPVTPESEPEPVAEVIDLGERREPTPETPVTPEDHEESRTLDDLREKIIEVGKDLFLSPDIYHKDRPSLQKVINYGKSGEWGPSVGPWRTAGKMYSMLIATPLVALAYLIGWTAERWSRLTVALVMLVSLWLLFR